jgi:hypothetical protein
LAGFSLVTGREREREQTQLGEENPVDVVEVRGSDRRVSFETSDERLLLGGLID